MKLNELAELCVRALKDGSDTILLSIPIGGATFPEDFPQGKAVFYTLTNVYRQDIRVKPRHVVLEFDAKAVGRWLLNNQKVKEYVDKVDR